MKNNNILVVNPISGGLDKDALIESINVFVEKHKINLFTYYTSGVADSEEIKELCNSLKPDRMIVAGGDGTIKMVAEAVQDFDVIIGILPAGSANGLAVDLNLPETVEENLEIAFFNHYMEMDIICINGKKSIHLSDIGLNAEMIKNYEGSAIRGKLGYALQTLYTLADLDDPFTATITGEFPTVICEARMIVIANSQKYGTGISINPNGKMDDGKFELVILKNMDLIILGKIITGNIPLDTDDIEIISTEKATIITDIPVSFQIDGEYCGMQNQLDIKILPKQMKVAIPRSEQLTI
ncbi:lipid kinase, YegS/Rv2252/BmrU family [Flavobacterium segetis]|uniref:Lipid kinase, YegS/Rv2252/BmrU family n=1 Tax=Flavobacterium segetis TaxID=271157 RepID=A0A1M5GW71_9FLAO|nr:diacylglycerol kinase family protein [Flavobacterium segetis]SHG07973.1 lipid kinase, YegS/Rv2252/BmrU family [Flavobacterium segetis]